jgi:chromosome segregation ATPase
MTRREKKQVGWMVTNVVNYYKILPDGEEEKMNEEDSVQTTKLIQETVGTPKDFDLVSLATGKNLDSLIDFTTTENGKIFTKFIGLEIMEMKEELARAKYNAFTKTMKANTYNIVDLQEEVENANTHLEMSEGLFFTATNNKAELVAKIAELEGQKLSLLNSKEKIDDKLALSNPTKLDLDIDEYTKAGVKTKDTLTEVLEFIEQLKSVTYDEYREKRLSDDVVKLTTNVAVKKSEIQTHNRDILNLKNSEVCHACHRPLEGINNGDKIKVLEALIELTNSEISAMETEKVEKTAEIASFTEIKESLNRKQRLELERDRLNVKLDDLRNKVKESKNLKAEYEANLKAIEFNKKVDSSVSLTTSNIQVVRHEHDELIKKIENIKNEINRLKEKIDFNVKMISVVEKELTVEKMYKLYVDMVGKKGVSKIVLRSVLPIINSELERLLEGVCDFDVEVRMDDKNEVHLMMIKDGIEGPLKSTSGFERTVSSVALRCVLGVVSTLPMPNFIAFDEVLDKVAPESIPNMKPLFDKIKDMYDKVFIITHDELARDWSDKMITITKKDNVSVINYSN